MDMITKNIILIGMPGTGKSTLGFRLARQIGRTFIDTDKIIEQAENKKIADIISEKGEDHFIKAEQHAAERLHAAGLVVSTGGSMALNESAMKQLSQTGTVVFIDCPINLLAQRLSNPERIGRVIGRQNMNLQELFEYRLPYYQKWAQITVAITGTDAEQNTKMLADAVSGII